MAELTGAPNYLSVPSTSHHSAPALINVHAAERIGPGRAHPPSVGAIIQTRPFVNAVVRLAYPDFDRVWALALAGHLRFARLVFTKPRYGKALLVSVSFSDDRKSRLARRSAACPRRDSKT